MASAANEQHKRNFQLAIEEMNAKLGIAATDAWRKVALDTLTLVVYKTPVRTGLARANWFVNLDTPSKTKTKNVNRDSVDIGGDLIDVAPLELSINISNNLSYIEALESGTSDQAPQGMVAATLQEIEDWYADIDMDDYL